MPTNIFQLGLKQEANSGFLFGLSSCPTITEPSSFFLIRKSPNTVTIWQISICGFIWQQNHTKTTELHPWNLMKDASRPKIVSPTRQHEHDRVCFHPVLKNYAWVLRASTSCGGMHSTDCHSFYKRHQWLEARDGTCSLYDSWTSKTTCENLNTGWRIFSINDVLKYLPKHFINVLTGSHKSNITIW